MVNATMWMMWFSLSMRNSSDEQYRDVPFPEQNVDKVEKLTKWNLKILIEEEEYDILRYREFLEEWASVRRTARQLKNHMEATKPLNWLEYLPETSISYTLYQDSGEDNEPVLIPGGWRTRAQAQRNDQCVVSWERSPMISKSSDSTLKDSKKKPLQTDSRSQNEPKPNSSKWHRTLVLTHFFATCTLLKRRHKRVVWMHFWPASPYSGMGMRWVLIKKTHVSNRLLTG